VRPAGNEGVDGRREERLDEGDTRAQAPMTDKRSRLFDEGEWGLPSQTGDRWREGPRTGAGAGPDGKRGHAATATTSRSWGDAGGPAERDVDEIVRAMALHGSVERKMCLRTQARVRESR